MIGDSNNGPKFVERVREHTRRYVHALTEENSTLRQKLEVLESQKQIVESWVKNLESALENEREERANLLERINELEKIRVSAAEEYAMVEQENNHLAHLYSATFSLHGSLDREKVLGVIQEIVINLIGSEEVAIFEVGEDGQIRISSHFGLDTASLEDVTLDNGLIARTVESGLLYLREETGTSADGVPALTTCVPLKVDGRVMGAIAVFRLLEQKRGLQPLDLELLDLLGSQAAIALHSANLHARQS